MAREINVDYLENLEPEPTPTIAEEPPMQVRKPPKRSTKILQLTTKNIKTPKATATRPIKMSKDQIEEKLEFLGTVRGGLIKLASAPMKDEYKNKELQGRLNQSKTIKRFLDEKLYADYLANLNIGVRSAIVYGYHFLDVSRAVEPPLAEGSISPSQ